MNSPYSFAVPTTSKNKTSEDTEDELLEELLLLMEDWLLKENVVISSFVLDEVEGIEDDETEEDEIVWVEQEEIEDQELSVEELLAIYPGANSTIPSLYDPKKLNENADCKPTISEEDPIISSFVAILLCSS